jgi:hypothetical protein
MPVPSPDDHQRWQDQGWQPERQAAFLEALEDRVQPLVWDAEQRDRWSQSYQAAKDSALETAPDAFAMTCMQLIEALPRSVTGVDTVAAYRGLDALRQDTGFGLVDNINLGPGLASAVLASEFAVPAALDTPPQSLNQELEVLGSALAISSSKDYQRNRRAYWRWLRDFTSGVITDIDAVEEAVEELKDLMEEQRELAHDAQIDTVVRTGLLAAEVTLGLVVAAAFPPIALAGAAVAIGNFTWTQLQNRRAPQDGDEAKVTAFFCQIDDVIRQEYFVNPN